MTRFERFHHQSKENRWMYYFTVFCRVMLAIGFIISGYVKITGERFASGLPVNNPMGHYLQALFETGPYYTFIGISQLIIAILLLVPVTSLLGAILYLPVILNICVLAYATRFEGTRITTLMLIANLYLLCWDYDRLKYILAGRKSITPAYIEKITPSVNKFPFKFFGSALLVVATVIVVNIFIFDIRPGNSLPECTNSCKESKYPKAAKGFCNCIYHEGKPLDSCLREYRLAKDLEKDNILDTFPR